MSLAEYAVFSTSDFNPSDYANAILAGEPYAPQSQQPVSRPPTAPAAKPEQPAKEDISVAISKLNFGIDDVTKQIKNLVTSHHQELLSQATSASELSGSLTSVRAGLTDLDSSLEKLRLKIRVPYQSLQTHVARLETLQQASDVLRRTSRFIVLARRLQLQMVEMNQNSSSPDVTKLDVNRVSTPGLDHEDEKERTIAKAALSIAELAALLDSQIDPISLGSLNDEHAPPTARRYPKADDTDTEEPDQGSPTTRIPLRSINAVSSHVRFIEDARARVTSEMENMVLTGLSTLNQSMLASSLQTAYNLRVLPELVQSLVTDLSQAVEERIRSAFDLARISKDAVTKDTPPAASQSPTLYKSRIRTEPTNLTAPQWTAALWARLDNLIEEMAACCVKVYTLEKVLKVKKDTVSQVVFLDEAMQLLENRPSAIFWTSLGRSLEKHSKDSARASTFLQQTLSTGYPKLLRLFHEFFAKIAVQTDTVYTQAYQSPETVLILRALSNFESLYLSRSSNKLNEAVGQAVSGGARAPPGANEGTSVARAVANELDSARFDPLLVKSVSRNAVTSLEMLLSRLDGLVVRDRSSVTLMGPSATPQQITNAQVASCMYQCWLRLATLEDEYPDAVFSALKPSVQSLKQAYDRIIDPISTAIRRELAAIIARLHRIDFAKSVDPMAGMGGPSVYMKDLVDKLSYVKTEILSRYNVGDAGRAWVMSILKYVIKTFVLHVSIARPLGESGKLQLTSDMTELEFALSAFMVENPQSKRGGNLDLIGEEYKTLRAMRPLLFFDNAQLADPRQTAGLPPLIVLHHILVRSPVPLPHSLHGWQEAEYVRWVDEHTEQEAWTLVEGGLVHWEKTDGVGEQAMEYVGLARTVLKNALA